MLATECHSPSRVNVGHSFGHGPGTNSFTKSGVSSDPRYDGNSSSATILGSSSPKRGSISPSTLFRGGNAVAGTGRRPRSQPGDLDSNGQPLSTWGSLPDLSMQSPSKGKVRPPSPSSPTRLARSALAAKIEGATSSSSFSSPWCRARPSLSSMGSTLEPSESLTSASPTLTSRVVSRGEAAAATGGLERRSSAEALTATSTSWSPSKRLRNTRLEDFAEDQLLQAMRDVRDQALLPPRVSSMVAPCGFASGASPSRRHSSTNAAASNHSSASSPSLLRPLGTDAYVLSGGTVPPSFLQEDAAGGRSLQLPCSSSTRSCLALGASSSSKLSVAQYWTELGGGPTSPQRGQIFAPSGSAANDTSRVYNAGKSLMARKAPVSKSLSASTLSKSRGLAYDDVELTDWEASLNPKALTPRSFRNLVREAEALSFRYNPQEIETEGGSYSLDEAARENLEFFAQRRSSIIPPHKVGPDAVAAPWKPKIGQEVGWKGPSDAALQRTKLVLSSLHSLRRVGGQKGGGDSEEGSPQHGATSSRSQQKSQRQKARPARRSKLTASADSSAPPTARSTAEAASEDPAPASQPDEDGFMGPEVSAGKASTIDEEEAELSKLVPGNEVNVEDLLILTRTLVDLEDTTDLLDGVVAELEEQYGISKDAGAARHPTALIAMRTLLVVKRKLHLISKVTDRRAALEAAWGRRQQIVDTVVAGMGEAPSEILGLAGFIRRHVHSPGEPVDADKSDFPAFAKSFGLPKKHCCVARIKDMLSKFADFWAVATLKKAEAGADVEGVVRLLDVGKSMTGGKKTPAMMEAQEAICDAIAGQVLHFAKEMQRKDAAAVERSDVPQVESAAKCAFDINTQIKEAINMGCATSHPALSEAKQMAAQLEVESKARIAQKAELHAKQALAKDDKVIQETGPDKIVQVGFGSKLAESIDDCIKRCLKEGAPKDHPFFEAAKDIAKELRERDGERKRLLARQDRLAKQAGSSS